MERQIIQGRCVILKVPFQVAITNYSGEFLVIIGKVGSCLPCEFGIAATDIRVLIKIVTVGIIMSALDAYNTIPRVAPITKFSLVII